MLTRGGDCTGATPPAFVTRAGDELFPSARTCREHLAWGEPDYSPPSLGTWMLHHGPASIFGSSRTASAWQSRALLGCRRQRNPAVLGDARKAEEAARPPHLCLKGTVLPQHQLRCCAPSKSSRMRPEADAELPQSRAGTQGSSLMCHPHRGTCHPLKPNTCSPWSWRDTHD